MALIALDDASSGWTEVDGPKTDLARSIEELLVEKGPMLDEYFSMIIDAKGNMCSLPLLLGGSQSQVEGVVLLYLATIVWLSCLSGLAKSTNTVKPLFIVFVKKKQWIRENNRRGSHS
jgi:hypothetical protein